MPNPVGTNYLSFFFLFFSFLNFLSSLSRPLGFSKAPLLLLFYFFFRGKEFFCVSTGLLCDSDRLNNRDRLKGHTNYSPSGFRSQHTGILFWWTMAMERYSPSGTNGMFGRGTEYNRGISLRDRENTVFQKMTQKCLHSTRFALENLAQINESLAKLMQALRVNSSISFHTSTEQTCRPAGGIFKCPWHDASTEKY